MKFNILCLIASCIFLTGCAAQKQLGKKDAYTLDDCLKVACANNLDNRLAELEQRVAEENRTSAMQNEWKANDPPPRDPWQSINQSFLPLDLEGRRRLIDQLDFALAVADSRQVENRRKLSELHRYRAKRALYLDICRVYLKLAAAQSALRQISECQPQFTEIQNLLNSVERTKNIPVLKTLDLRSRTLQLTNWEKSYRKKYRNNCRELSQLLGCDLPDNFRVDESVLLRSPGEPPPNPFEVALEKRPELAAKPGILTECRKWLQEQDYTDFEEKRICDKLTLRLLENSRSPSMNPDILTGAAIIIQTDIAVYTYKNFRSEYADYNRESLRHRCTGCTPHTPSADHDPLTEIREIVQEIRRLTAELEKLPFLPEWRESYFQLQSCLGELP